MSSTIKILNPSNTWTPRKPKYLRVAKPYTEEWCRKMRNDWFFRCYQDFINLKDKGWSFWFPTLTYNNECLPKLQINDFVPSLPVESSEPNSSCIDIPDSEIAPCFDKEHVVLFTKELRIYLNRRGYDVTGMKYLICSEFGENTRRPHFHAWIALPFTISADDMLDVLRSVWHYGFVGASRLGLEVTNAYAIRYATKYVVKDLAYKYIMFPSGRTLDYYVRHQDGYEVKELYKILSPFMPKLFASKGVGSSYLHYLNSLDKKTKINLCLQHEKINLPLGNGIDFGLPRYYVNKLCYGVDRDLTAFYGRVIMYLTPLGVDVERERFMQRIDKTYERLRDVDFNTCSGIDCLNLFYKIRKVDLRDLAWYHSFFRFMVVSDSYSSVDALMLNRDVLFRDALSVKASVYKSDFLFHHGLVDADWIAENSACSLYSRPLIETNFAAPEIRCKTYSELSDFKVFEEASKAFDIICDKLFDKKEYFKKEKRQKKDADKFLCLQNNPDLFIVYESYKDFEVLDCHTSVCG